MCLDVKNGTILERFELEFGRQKSGDSLIWYASIIKWFSFGQVTYGFLSVSYDTCSSVLFSSRYPTVQLKALVLFLDTVGL